MLKRKCGSCSACCRLVPVLELGRDAGALCPHRRKGKGCAIYDHRPDSCRYWSCLWLSGGAATSALRRPDRSGYVLDCLPDFITGRNEETGVETKFEVVQIWTPGCRLTLESALIAYLESRRAGAVIRSRADAVALIPPWVSPNGEWALTRGQSEGREHSQQEIDGVLREIRI